MPTTSTSNTVIGVDTPSSSEKNADAIAPCTSIAISTTHSNTTPTPSSSSVININLFTPPTTSTAKNPTHGTKRDFQSEDEANLKHTHRGGRHYVECIPCLTYPDVVKIHTSSQNKKLPAIATEGGTLYRKETVDHHFNSLYHAEASKKFKLASLSSAEKLQSTDIGKYISTQNEKLANKIGNLMLQVYCDAKKLTLPAWNFPARVVTSYVASNFSFNSQRTVADDVKNFDFQYVTPSFHLELLKCIANSYRSTFREMMKNSVASSLRCDGSVDRMQIDKIYVAAKIVSKEGEIKQLFLGAAEPESRGANGILQAMKKAFEMTLNCREGANLIIQNASSLVTDGASVNTGEQAGLWRIFDDEKKAGKTAGEADMPLVVIWCAVHRSALAWKSVTNSISEISHLIQTISAIQSYFHLSGLRTEELKKTAREKNTKLMRFPKYFEVRWCEFTNNLINSILASWVTLVTYFENRRNEKECNGYYRFLTNEENLCLMAHLADILSVFSHYQKKLQADTLTIVQLPKLTKSVKEQLENLKNTALIGGWVSQLTENLTNRNEEDNTIVLHGITLQRAKLSRRKTHHLYVTEKRNTTTVVNDAIESLKNFLDGRLSIDDAIIAPTEKFVGLQPDADLKEIHRIWAKDLNLQELGHEYQDILQLENVSQLRVKSLLQLVNLFLGNKHTLTIGKVMARILVAKPHSADVERLISKNNLLKTSLRNSMTLQTENLYMFINENMPPLEKWEPRSAVLSWLNDKNRRERETTKAKQQAWFKGIFFDENRGIDSDCKNEGDGEEEEGTEREFGKSKSFL